MMGALYIGGQKSQTKFGAKAKIYFFLFVLFFGLALKLTAPMIVEVWMNRNGASGKGYAFSIREVNISLSTREMTLIDVKVFNPKTSSEMIEIPNLVMKLDWAELILYQNKNFSLFADQVDLIISKDLSSEMKRIQSISNEEKKEFYLDAVEAKFSKLNIIEQKENESRTVLELNDVNVNVKEISLLSINKKTEFNVSSNIANGGKLNLTGKTNVEEGITPWSIQGSFSQVPTDIFNKMAGNKLPFSFNESHLNAEINAYSANGKVIGEIEPEIRKLNILNEKPGVPTQSIARILTDDLTFTLPFTVKDELTLQYAETYKKLKAYRKYPAASGSSGTAAVKVSQTPKPKKTFSFWPF